MEENIAMGNVPSHRIHIAVSNWHFFTEEDILKWARDEGPVLGAALAQRVIQRLSQIIVETLELK